MTFLAACLTVSRLLVGDGAGTFSTLARASLAIGGWVAVVAAVAIPDVSLFAQHNYQSGVPFLGANNVVAGLRLTYNIFDWGKRAGVIREREAQLAEAEEEVRRIDHRVTIEIEKAFRRVQRVTSVVSVARELCPRRGPAPKTSSNSG